MEGSAKVPRTPCARNYVFTVNFSSPDEMYQLMEADIPSWVSYMTWQLEMGETGRPHLQGYMELSGAHTMKQLHKVPGFETAHFEVRRGTQEEARRYARKDEGRIEGPWEIGVLKVS